MFCVSSLNSFYGDPKDQGAQEESSLLFWWCCNLVFSFFKILVILAKISDNCWKEDLELKIFTNRPWKISQWVSPPLHQVWAGHSTIGLAINLGPTARDPWDTLSYTTISPEWMGVWAGGWEKWWENCGWNIYQNLEKDCSLASMRTWVQTQYSHKKAKGSLCSSNLSSS